jgi:4-amino-4-deoxy-L-arabinose transferase-like glycosyltransferase
MNRERLRFWLWTGVALLAGLLLRLWFASHMGRVAGDGLFYGEIAKTWLQHGVYGVTDGGPTPGSLVVRPTLARLPGYPLFLAACFRLFGMENYRAVMNVQIAADLVTCCLVSALAGRLFGRRARLWVLWLAALCPFTANYSSTVLAETLVFTTIALAFYACARWQDAGQGTNLWLWTVAAALAYSILLRPEQGLLAAAVLPAMLWRSLTTNGRSERRWHQALPVVMAAFCVALPLLLWTARNERIFHVFQPLSPRDASDPSDVVLHGFGRWYGSWAIDFASTDEVCWPMDGERIEFSDVPERAFAAATPAASQEMRRRTAALLDDYNATLTC